MRLKCLVRYSSISKVGNSENENEDSVLVPSNSEIKSKPVIKFAISDGASESSFSKEWSELLVSCYKDKPFDLVNLPFTIKAISEVWQSKISVFDLPWYAQQKLEMGAFATFLGLTLNLDEQTYEAVSIGDCTLFHVRNDTFIYSFPTTSFEDFGNTPSLFATNPKFQTDLEKSVKYLKAKEVKSGDLLILATDALARWIFERLNECGNPWLNLQNFLKKECCQEDFTNWIFDKIKEEEIKNDDISVILISIE